MLKTFLAAAHAARLAAGAMKPAKAAADCQRRIAGR